MKWELKLASSICIEITGSVRALMTSFMQARSQTMGEEGFRGKSGAYA